MDDHRADRLRAHALNGPFDPLDRPDWVVVHNYGSTLHLRHSPHRMNFHVATGTTRRPNRWLVHAAEDIGATVCPQCLWHALDHAPLAVAMPSFRTPSLWTVRTMAEWEEIHPKEVHP